MEESRTERKPAMATSLPCRHGQRHPSHRTGNARDLLAATGVSCSSFPFPNGRKRFLHAGESATRVSNTGSMLKPTSVAEHRPAPTTVVEAQTAGDTATVTRGHSAPPDYERTVVFFGGGVGC